MNHASTAFGPFDGRIWLNTAHQGPLPWPAVEAAHRAIELKIAPARLVAELFDDVPRRLRTALASLLGVPADEVILGNSTTHGLHQIVLGYPWQRGDEVLLVQGDFPATTLPWLVLEQRGVQVRWIEAGDLLTAEALDGAIGAATRIFCTTWVHSFLGHALDLDAIGRVCRSRAVWFVVNASQGLGALPLDLRSLPIDALTSCGHKFLCGPYGTGVCWIRPALRNMFRPTQGYWLTHVDLGSLEGSWTARLRSDVGVSGLDVFAPANFFNFMTWTAAVEYLVRRGLPAIYAHDQQLVVRLIDGLEDAGGRIVSPRTPPARSSLLVLAHPQAREAAAALQAEGIDVAVREGRLRISPHVHNSADDVGRLLAVLAQWLAHT
jgi:selenocysteine lyase/cysteine desulfurase